MTSKIIISRALRLGNKKAATSTVYKKLKVKFSLIVKALGDTGKSDEEIEKALPSHAFHLVKLAQEKADILKKTIKDIKWEK